MAKQYKPGQLITIKNIVYQIVRKKDMITFVCKKCAFYKFNALCREEICNKVPIDCYLKRITPCINQDN